MLTHGVRSFLRKNIFDHGKRLFSKSFSHCKVPLTDVLKKWATKFEDEGIPDAVSSAEYITAHVVGKKTLYGVNKDEYFLDDADVVAINDFCKLRMRRMPVQYILGEWDFDGLTLKMMPPVLIPRPETEELVTHCKHILESSQCLMEHHRRPVIVEIGCGTGAISLALLKHFKELQSVCLDILPEACTLTQSNAETVGVKDRIHIINGNFTHSTVISELQALGPYCLLVSNPPYVTCDQMKDLSPEISRFESSVALDGGVDGLDLVRHILYQARALVMPNRHVFLEVGENHPDVIENFVIKNKSLRLQYIRGIRDINERNRFCHLQVID